MTADERTSWFHRLYKTLLGESPPGVEGEPVEATVQLLELPVRRHGEDWRELLQSGRPVTVVWTADGERGEQVADGAVRLTVDDGLWIWLNREVEPERRPRLNQAIHLLLPQPDALRVIPCRLVEETQGGSMQVAVCGRIRRVQRRDDVRARVTLPPVSAMRLSPAGRPLGILGVRLVDVSAGGIAFETAERLRAEERLRIVLNLDDGPALTPVVRVLQGGAAARGQFSIMPESERRRIVQFVYRLEVEERRRAQEAQDRAAD